ncbi:MAG: hypothetical protein ACKO4X_03985 [Alphaproteobacteria bacterium]
MVTAEKHHFIRDLTIGGMMAEDLAIVTKLPVFWGQLSNFTADRCALPACGRSEAIARSWIRSAIQGSVMGDIREGWGDAEGAEKCKPGANLGALGLQLSY